MSHQKQICARNTDNRLNFPHEQHKIRYNGDIDIFHWQQPQDSRHPVSTTGILNVNIDENKSKQ